MKMDVDHDRWHIPEPPAMGVVVEEGPVDSRTSCLRACHPSNREDFLFQSNFSPYSPSCSSCEIPIESAEHL